MMARAPIFTRRQIQPEIQLGTYGRWAFAEFTEVYQIEADFEKKIESEFNKMIEMLAHEN